MAVNKCKDLNDIMHLHGFQNLVKGIQAQNMVKVSLFDVIERKWKFFIARLPENEKEQVSTFTQCLKDKKIKRLSMCIKGNLLDCGHENCETLLARLFELLYVSEVQENMEDAKEADMKQSETEKPVIQHEELRALGNKESQSETQGSYSDSCFSYYWELAKLFIDVFTDDDISLRGGLDVMSLIRLMKSCRLFEFKDSCKVYDKVSEDRDAMVYVPDLQIPKKQLNEIIQNLKIILENFSESFVSCSDTITDLNQLETEVVNSEKIEYKFLVKNVLSAIDSDLNLDKTEMDFNGMKSKSDAWLASKEEVSSLLFQINELLSEPEEDEVWELKAENENLKTKVQTTKNELDSKCAAFQKEIKRLETENENLRRKLETLEELLEEVPKLKTENENLKTEVQTTRNELDIKCAEFKEEIKRLETENENLRRKLETFKELLEEVPKLKTENENLKTEVQTTRNELHIKCEAFQNETKRLETENENLRRQLRELLGEVSELKAKNEILKTEVQITRTEVDSKCEAFKKEIKRLETENENLRRNLETLEVTLEQYNEVAATRYGSDYLQSRMKKLELDREWFDAENRNLKETVRRLERERDDYKQKVHRLSGQSASNMEVTVEKFKVLHEKDLLQGQKVTVLQGDIVQITADAIVHPTNSTFETRGAVGSALGKVGGDTFLRDVKALQLSHGSLEVAKAALCQGKNFPAKYVIHVHSPGWRHENAKQLLDEATKNVLKLADEHSIRSIAIPSISSGHAGFPKLTAAETILRAINNYFFANSRGSLKQVYFVLFDAESVTAYITELRRLSV